MIMKGKDQNSSDIFASQLQPSVSGCAHRTNRAGVLSF
jgi:hypothetical protein